MKVIRAKCAGACYGVKRALDLANKAAQKHRVACSLGPLIHNPQVVAELATQGVRTVDDLDEIRADEAVIIRSHGVVPQVIRRLEEKKVELIDATCPHVARAQRAAAELAASGATVIVVGELGHPEVEGLFAYACEASLPGGHVYIVAAPEDLPLDLKEPVGVVVQTTQTKKALDVLVEALEKRGITAQVKDTICSATRKRQDAAAELATQVDAFVVVGGRNSSNTTRLADICRKRCAHTYHIEAVDELEPSWFADCQVVGLSAGASTPEEQIAAVEEALGIL